MNKRRDIIKVTDGNEHKITLETDPTQAKKYERESKWGNQVSYGYFIDNNKMFFATQFLHDLLQRFNKGASVSVKFKDRKWEVNPINLKNSNEQETEKSKYPTTEEINAEIQF